MTEEHRTKEERIQAQHEETGRMWEGPRDRVPKGYSELPPSKDQSSEHIAWALRAHEDLAKMLADGGGNMLHVRANRALGILFAEIERLEKIAYPIGAADEPFSAPPTAEHLANFSDWLNIEMPAGTVIGNQNWWARKLLNAAYVTAPERPAPPPAPARWRCVSYCLCNPSEKQGHFVRDDEAGAWVKFEDLQPALTKAGE